jgi:hypothetical protein
MIPAVLLASLVAGFILGVTRGRQGRVLRQMAKAGASTIGLGFLGLMLNGHCGDSWWLLIPAVVEFGSVFGIAGAGVQALFKGPA